ncbi:unnamed protein product [Trichogramma brassicae]|uniref:Uncharacterized protein n=1 Tax=Trichogramma brassicae TaxID=86971 RepID=A0A6H5IBS8_9HYME|nr:unnamed protein product [Trichogramma brassicae]
MPEKPLNFFFPAPREGSSSSFAYSTTAALKGYGPRVIARRKNDKNIASHPCARPCITAAAHLANSRAQPSRDGGRESPRGTRNTYTHYLLGLLVWIALIRILYELRAHIYLACVSVYRACIYARSNVYKFVCMHLGTPLVWRSSFVYPRYRAGSSRYKVSSEAILITGALAYAHESGKKINIKKKLSRHVTYIIRTCTVRVGAQAPSCSVDDDLCPTLCCNSSSTRIEMNSPRSDVHTRSSSSIPPHYIAATTTTASCICVTLSSSSRCCLAWHTARTCARRFSSLARARVFVGKIFIRILGQWRVAAAIYYIGEKRLASSKLRATILLPRAHERRWRYVCQCVRRALKGQSSIEAEKLLVGARRETQVLVKKLYFKRIVAAAATVRAISTMQSSAAAFSMENNHSFAYGKRNREEHHATLVTNQVGILYFWTISSRKSTGFYPFRAPRHARWVQEHHVTLVTNQVEILYFWTISSRKSTGFYPFRAPRHASHKPGGNLVLLDDFLEEVDRVLPVQSTTSR